MRSRSRILSLGALAMAVSVAWPLSLSLGWRGGGGGNGVAHAGTPIVADRGAGTAKASGRVRYDRDVRPILSDRCFLCHGPDEAKRMAGLRLDDPASATAEREGRHAIVPGDPQASELWRRITTHVAEDAMPPAASGKRSLSAEEQALLRKWIEQGAEYEPHWSFVPPVRPEPPVVSDPAWCRNPIDRFVLARLDEAGLRPGPEAPPETLLRRVFLDLTGLPPTEEEIAAYLADERDDPAAYERWVDRLLTEEPYRTRYAENMAVPWLDHARYADTCGIHMDAGRSIWPWRDWVLDAYRRNMPFDQFVVEQIAGDLLPDATQSQRVASGFNRNHVTTDEGGVIAEEYLVEYAVDRVNTTGAVFLGLTVGCARCHDHKFDPIPTEDFYRLYAFFNSNDEPGLYSQTQDAKRAFEPFMTAPSPEQAAKLDALLASAAAIEAERAAPAPGEDVVKQAFLDDLAKQTGVAWRPTTVVEAHSAEGATLAVQPDGSVLVSGTNPERDDHTLVLRIPGSTEDGLRVLSLEAIRDASLPEGRVGRAPNGNAVLTGISVEAASIADPTRRRHVDFAWGWADIEQTNGDYKVVNAMLSDSTVGTAAGWAVDAHNQPGNRHALFVAREPFGYEGGTELSVRLEYRSVYSQHVFGRVRVTAGSMQEAALARLPAAAGSWFHVGPFPEDDRSAVYDAVNGPESAVAIDLAADFKGKRWMHDQRIAEAVPVSFADGVNVEYVGRRLLVPTPRMLDVSLGSDDGIRVFRNGVEVFGRKVERGLAPDQDRASIELPAGEQTLVFKIVNTGGASGFFHRTLPAENVLDHDVVGMLLPPAALDGAFADRVDRAWRTQFSPRYRELTARLEAVRSELAKVEASIPKTMVMKELPEPRPTFVLARGQYDHADTSRPVERGIPAALGTLADDAPRNRLGLAEWLVGDTNPLTARVTVNRLWEQFFGHGIVRTSEDFGYQGEWPTHPELLDWMAIEFRDGGWDQQALIRTIVTSSTYRQSSRQRPEALAVDPDNRLLAYFPRQRLTAEEIRDQALYIGGLLVERLGGPSVKPYQPEGLWREIAMIQSNTREYVRGMGEDLWRRSLYTYWKRAAPPPSMLTFDAPTREFCTIRRIPTNTPLQALVLWNDVQFVEAARGAAGWVLARAGDDGDRLTALYRRCTARALDAERAALMLAALDDFRARYNADPDAAAKLLALGEAPLPEGVPPAELAAWTMLANALLSTDAVIVKN
ncbi:MAG: PSD1 domain-containing protein [Phycisphaerales bacterium]|nr:PSD1 domain-containing protein [Phycisphaerales bacterium]